MKNVARTICCLLLVLPCVAHGASAMSPRAGKLSATDERTPPGLRGGPLGAKQQLAAALPTQHSIVALQSSQSTHLQKATTGSKQKRSHSWLQRLFKTKSHVVLSKKHEQALKTGICKGNKLRWWIKVAKKCKKAYGKSSRWDRDLLQGKCAEAWSTCSTGFYAVCCTQPIGPKDMETYCAKQNMTVVAAGAAKPDKACSVQRSMGKVTDLIRGIQDTVALLDADGTPIYGPGPGPAPGPAPAPAIPLPPPGLTMAAPAPAAVVLGPPLPMMSPLEKRCAMLTELTRQAAERIKKIKQWAKDDGMQHGGDDSKTHKKKSGEQQLEEDINKDLQSANAENPEAKDPDLVFSVQGVLNVGSKLDALLKDADFCNKGPEEDDDDDVEDDLAKDPTEDDEEDDEPVVTKVNTSAIFNLLNFGDDMSNAVGKFEKEVHPHGYKWWRYRYEYTIVESIVLAFSVICMYFVMWLLHGVSFFQVHKFYKTGLPVRLHRYAWAYLVFHAATLMIMVTVAYMLYIPWGKGNIFNVFAEAVHDLVDGRANVPFLGYSWLYMVLDVQFQLFVCFALYSLFIVMVAKNYITALEDWKNLSEEAGGSGHKHANVALYRSLDATIRRRVQNTPELKNMFTELKLRLSDVEGLDKVSEGWHEFKLHLYLTDGLGKSLECLCEVSLTTNIFLFFSALVVAVGAQHYQLAFMYFLPGFLFLGLLLFIVGYFVARHFRKLSDDDDHNTSSKYLTVRAYCRGVQVLLYCVFFSFSRLLLSNDIFEQYPMVYLAALISLLVVLALLALFAGHLIKETTCALILPPHVPQDILKKNLEQVCHWHTSEKCHQCGVQAFPVQASLSREWAGKRPFGERQAEPYSARPYSWRG